METDIFSLFFLFVDGDVQGRRFRDVQERILFSVFEGGVKTIMCKNVKTGVSAVFCIMTEDTAAIDTCFTHHLAFYTKHAPCIVI